jgi:hypothetical protein
MAKANKIEQERQKHKTKQHNADVALGWTQGFTCAVAILLRLEGMVTTQVKELYRMGGCKFNDFEHYNIDPNDIEILNQYKDELES